MWSPLARHWRMGMTRNIDRSTPVSLLRAGAAALLLGSVLAACSSAASTPGSAAATSGAAGATAPASAPAAGRTAAPVATAAAVAGRTADPVLANALTQLNGLTSYDFKLTVKGGSYATSVGPAGIAGTVVHKPTFAVPFPYADLEILEIQGNNWHQ